ncbi:MAG: DNA polymerase IV [Burkholderia sp.]|jgi:DNA polymerase IV
MKQTPQDPKAVSPGEGDEIRLTRDTHRKIVHIDMDAFFASVEQHDRPELRGRPVAVGHDDRRGVVATASYEARRFGVHSAMPSAMAKELCPQLVFVPGRMARYKEVSEQVRAIFRRYTDAVEPISIDEAFLDVTVNKKGMALGVDVARAIKRDIREELGLVASAGVSYNKFLAKVASDWRKPDGLCVIHPDRALAFIDKLPVEALWGVGPATAKKFHELGIHGAKELRAMPLADLLRHFGQAGWTFYRFARGIDDRPVRVTRERKSVGCEETYARDLVDPREIDEALAGLAAELEARLSRHFFRGRTLTLKIRWFDFSTHTRSLSRSAPFSGAADILECARELLAGAEIPRRGVRLLGLTVSSPETDEEPEPSLFDEPVR